MKRKIILSAALILSLTILLLTSSDSRVAAQNQIRIVADTGVVTLGPDQILRVTATGFDPGPLDGKFINFRRIEYTPGDCSGGICKAFVASQTASAPVALAPNTAVGIDCEGYAFCRVVVSSNSPKVRVNASVIDAATGKTQVLIALLLP